MRELLDKVVKISEKAGRAVMDVYTGGDFGASQKEDDSPLTKADLASNDIITTELSSLVPTRPVLSEESREVPFEERKDWRDLWIVDPLDGTKEFIKRNGEFTVNIALVSEGRPTLGVVHAPALGVTYFAATGEGAYKKSAGRTERIHADDWHGKTLKVVASRSHLSESVKSFVEKLEGEVEFVSMGSSLKLCLVADGSAHLYPRFGPTMEWDTAAAQCVVEEAGGRVTSLDGLPITYNREDLKNGYFIVVGEPPFPFAEYLDPE